LSGGIVGGGATTSVQNVDMTADFTTTSGTFVDVTGMIVTLANRSGGSALVTVAFTTRSSADTGVTQYQIEIDDVDGTAMQQRHTGTNDFQNVTDTIALALSGQVIQLQVTSIGGTNTVTVWGVTIVSHLSVLEIS